MSIVVTAIVKLTTLATVKAAIESGDVPQVIADNVLDQVAGLYRDFTYLGETYTCLDNILPSVNEIPIITAAFPDAVIIGAWDFDTGDLVQPFNQALYLEVMPDIVTYDADTGDVISTARPTVPKDINLYSGQKDRRFQ